MAAATVTAFFSVEAEAERVITQLRSAGVGDGDIRMQPCAEEITPRDQQVGVPDSAASLDGLRGDEDASPPRVKLEISLDHARVDRDTIVHIVNAAGGGVG